jgi:SH3-like domain-containing protein
MRTTTRFIVPLGLAVLGLIAAGAWAGGPARAQTVLHQAGPEPAKTQEDSEPAKTQAARTGPTGLPLPRFVTLRAPEVNMRTGPGVRYPIEWVYSRAGLPVEVIDEFETWRRVRDWEGSIGWVHQSMLSGDRKIMVIGHQRMLRRDPESEAVGAALLDPGVIAELNRCVGAWCEVKVKDLSGWLLRKEFYGVFPDEKVE